MMAQKRLFSVVLFMGLSVLGQACSPASKNEISPSNLSKPQSLLAGDYIGKTRDGEVYHSIVKLNVPRFGGDIFYHHISLEALRGPVFQRKVYAFQDSGPQMRSTVLLGPADGFTDEQTLAESLNSLPEESLLRFPDACQFQWTGAEGRFKGVVRRDSCSYESPAFGGFVSPEMEYKLSECGLIIEEGIFREDDSPVFPPSITSNRRTNTQTDECN